MSRPISRRVVIGMRTACAATAARQQGVQHPPSLGSDPELAVYETSPGRWRNGDNSTARVNGATARASTPVRDAGLLFNRNGTSDGASLIGQGHSR